MVSGLEPISHLGTPHAPYAGLERSLAWAKLLSDGFWLFGCVHCIASRCNRSTHMRAIELARSVSRASRLPCTLAFCIDMTAAAPIVMIVMAMRDRKRVG